MKITDLPKDVTLNRDEMQKVTGGFADGFVKFVDIDTPGAGDRLKCCKGEHSVCVKW